VLMDRKNLGVTLALSAFILAGAAASAQTAATDADLRQQVQDLEKRLAELEKGMAPASASAPAAPPSGAEGK